MKLAVFTSFTLVAILVAQTLGDDDSVKDKIEGFAKDVKDTYKEQISKFEKSSNDMKDKAEDAFKEINHNLEDKIKNVMSSVRSRRSPQTYPDSQKSPTEEALDSLNEKYDKFKGAVSGLVDNVTKSETYANAASTLDKFNEHAASTFDKVKNSLSDAGKKLKSSIHNLTASESTDSPKESN